MGLLLNFWLVYLLFRSKCFLPHVVLLRPGPGWNLKPFTCSGYTLDRIFVLVLFLQRPPELGPEGMAFPAGPPGSPDPDPAAGGEEPGR